MKEFARQEKVARVVPVRTTATVLFFDSMQTNAPTTEGPQLHKGMVVAWQYWKHGETHMGETLTEKMFKNQDEAYYTTTPY